jgi:hypothetical protein
VAEVTATATRSEYRVCGMCRRRRDKETMVYSPWTRTWYCGPREEQACDRLYRKGKKA